jgi:hypothetical protein
MSKRFLQFLWILPLFIVAHIHSSPHRGELIDDNLAAQLITVITTTSPLPSMPSLQHLYPAQASLAKIPAFTKCKKIIVFDGISPSYEDRAAEYEMYKNNVMSLIDTDPYFTNTELVFCEKWVHLAGTIKEAIKHVKTPFIFIYQHDDILLREFDLKGCLGSMILNPLIKYIHLTRYPNQGLPHTGDIATTWYGPVDNYVQGGSLVPLTRCFGFSDYAHISTVNYYKSVVLPICQNRRGFMETFMQAEMKKRLVGQQEESKINRIHALFGTYFYGDLTDGCYIFHSNGSWKDPQ